MIENHSKNIDEISSSPNQKLDTFSIRIISSHTFLKEAKKLLEDHMENENELDVQKLYFMIKQSKSLLDDLQREALKNFK